MKKILYKKGLVLGIILLFVGVSLAPGITATVNLSDFATPNITENKELNNDLVEITVEVGNSEYKVMLTPDQVIELNNLIESTKTKLDSATSVEETAQIFDDTVLSLYKLGIHPEGMSVEDAQRLVNSLYRNSRFVRKLEVWFSRNQENFDDNHNSLCLIAGYTTETDFIGPSYPFLWLLEGIMPPNLAGVLLFLELLNIGFWFLNPIPILYGINLGRWKVSGLIRWHDPAKGWIHTFGLNGIKSWRGSFFGNLSSKYSEDIGVLGFTGIKISNPLDKSFYLGVALRVKIE